MVLWLLEKVVERPDAVWLCLAATGFVSSMTVLVSSMTVLVLVSR
jgi:hypothetical protein